VLIDVGESRAALILESHNYSGYQGINGEAQLARLRELAERYGADLRSGGVTQLVREKSSYVARHTGGEPRARARQDQTTLGLVLSAQRSASEDLETTPPE
jgi:thioredoxin reductase (NADPH)